MKFGATLILLLVLVAFAFAFRTENRMQLRQDDEEELTCDICTAEYCESNFYNWASCCLADESCAEDDDDIARHCCRFPDD